MALGTITFNRYVSPRRGVRIREVLMVGPASYTGSGGEAVTAATFKLNGIDAIFFNLPYPQVNRAYGFDKTNSKIFIVVPSTGAEVAGAVACNADQVLMTVWGR